MDINVENLNVKKRLWNINAIILKQPHLCLEDWENPQKNVFTSMHMYPYEYEELDGYNLLIMLSITNVMDSLISRR